MDDAKYTGHLLENIRDELRSIHELVAEVPKMARKLDHIELDVTELKYDMKVVKAAVTDLSHQVSDHEHRVSRLEAA